MSASRAAAPAASAVMLMLCASGAWGTEGGPACLERKLLGEQLVFECTIDVAESPSSPRFVALFGGGHDDTMAALKAQADGVDAPCGAGSKPELMGEDGNVSVWCQLPVRGLAPGRHVMTVHLQWSHAQYQGFRLER